MGDIGKYSAVWHKEQEIARLNNRVGELETQLAEAKALVKRAYPWVDYWQYGRDEDWLQRARKLLGGET